MFGKAGDQAQEQELGQVDPAGGIGGAEEGAYVLRGRRVVERREEEDGEEGARDDLAEKPDLEHQSDDAAIDRGRPQPNTPTRP